MDSSEINNTTPQITESTSTHEQITPKNSWYSKIKDNPEELDKLRQKERNIILN
jgi:hypothetical protein